MTEGFLYKEMQMRLIKDSPSQNFLLLTYQCIIQEGWKVGRRFPGAGTKAFQPQWTTFPRKRQKGKIQVMSCPGEKSAWSDRA